MKAAKLQRSRWRTTTSARQASNSTIDQERKSWAVGRPGGLFREEGQRNDGNGAHPQKHYAHFNKCFAAHDTTPTRHTAKNVRPRILELKIQFVPIETDAAAAAQ
jgi:hypothetical protein